MKQISIFSFLYETYKIKKKIRLIELFGGIGSQAKALERLDKKGLLPYGFDHYKLVEFDKYPLASYNAVHNTNFSTLDITKVHASDLQIRERERFEYIMTYSFPCTDLSLAGKRAGMKRGSGTRSGLLWEVERILKECEKELPQILLMENVPEVIGKKNIKDFQEWELFLESLGYKNYVQCLNAKDYGIPQNRNRCFMVSILGDYYYEFPKKQKLKLILKDMLDEVVDKKYYLDQDDIDRISGWKSYQKPIDEIKKHTKICPTLTARGAGEEHSGMILIDEKIVKKIGSYSPSGHNAQSVVDPEGLAPTVMENHGRSTAVIVPKPELLAGVGDKKSNDGKQYYQQDRIYNNNNNIAISVTTDFNPYYADEDLSTVRKLTPCEAWLLMGFDREDYEKAAKVNSSTQLYKQAGNSIVVNVLEAIFSQFFLD